jgi:hypothetical protein
VAGSGLVERIQTAAQLLGLRQVRLVTDTAIRMVKGKFAKTSFQSDLVERDRSIRRGDHGHDARDGCVI